VASGVTHRVRIFPDLAAANRDLADHLEERAREAVRDRGRFSLVVSGGSTPEGLYRLLARRPPASWPWSRTEVFFADERAVPPTDPSSNYRAANALLLSKVAIPTGHVYRIEGERRPLGDAAARYVHALDGQGREPGGRTRPRFDVVLLGLGEDAHTASLFPNSTALRARRRWVVPVDKASQPPYVPRLTLTVPALASSREVCFLVVGASKAKAVGRVFRAPPGGADDVPASRISSRGPVRWFLDRSAAAPLLLGEPVRTGRSRRPPSRSARPPKRATR
jgi:6-phosphogluconolactonase